MPRRFSIVIPTADRERYLEPALLDLDAQEFPPDEYEIVVVDDAEEPTSREVVERVGARSRARIRYERREGPRGINASRNTGIRRSSGEVVAFVDDDCRFAPGWLAALARGVELAPRADCFGGPIRACLEPGHPRSCGRDAFPITVLDHGPSDRYVDLVFGANFSVRRSAFDRIGLFDQDARLYGDEVDWILRLRRRNGLVRYVAGAGVEHVRLADDVTVKRMLRGALTKGANVARFDAAQGIVDPPAAVFRRAIRLSAHALVFRCWSAATHALQAYVYAYHAVRAR
jgi:glycosyltransferase involved in cell wall biosynthesis